MSRQSGKKYRSSNKSKASGNTGQLRIIAGKWRSRKIFFSDVAGLRPTPARIRETLFNWLTPVLPASHCLDLFAGSGALGFEALSRGAEFVTLLDQNPQIIMQLQDNKKLLVAENLQILNQDAMDLSAIRGRFDIVFCDPPFNLGLIQPLINKLHECNLLSDSAKLYMETEKNLTSLHFPEGWQLLKEKVAGDVRYRLISISKCSLAR